MLIIDTSLALSRLPYDQAFPFNSTDIMLMATPDYGFRLKNITDELGEKFDLTATYEANEAVFGKVSLKTRINDLAKHFTSRIDRFFITKKSGYLFFDSEEQEFLKKTLSRAGLSCSIDIFKVSENGDVKIIDYRLIPDEDIEAVRFMSECTIRVVDTLYNSHKKCSRLRSTRRYENGFYYNKSERVDYKEEFFNEYKHLTKLRDIKNQLQFKKYAKALRVKYHPDKSKHPRANEIAQRLAEEISKIEESQWYLTLPEDDIPEDKVYKSKFKDDEKKNDATDDKSNKDNDVEPKDSDKEPENPETDNKDDSGKEDGKSTSDTGGVIND